MAWLQEKEKEEGGTRMGSNSIVVNEELFFEVPDSKMPAIMQKLKHWKKRKPRERRKRK